MTQAQHVYKQRPSMKQAQQYTCYHEAEGYIHLMRRILWTCVEDLVFPVQDTTAQHQAQARQFLRENAGIAENLGYSRKKVLRLASHPNPVELKSLFKTQPQSRRGQRC